MIPINTKLVGVRFGDWHTWKDFNLILAQKVIGSAEPKISTIEIPGADGLLDISECFGEMTYNNRKLAFEFRTIIPRKDFLNLYSKIKNAIHGKKLKIILDEDPDFYYIGRISVSDWESKNKVGIVSIECDCEPYKYKIYETVVREAVKGEKDVILNNLRKRTYPLITVDSTMQVEFNDYTFTLTIGTYSISEFYLKEGKNLVTVKGDGVIEFRYQEGSL